MNKNIIKTVSLALIASLGFIMAGCSEAPEQAAEAVDSAATEVIDSAAAVVDSTVNATVDSAKAEVAEAADSVKAAVTE